RRAVFDPIAAALDGRTRLLLAPDGDLTRLPFGVLPADDGRLLIEEYAISYVSCGRDVLRFGAETTGRPAAPVVVADPDFDFSGRGNGTMSRVVEERSASRGSRDLDQLRFPVERLPATRIEGRQLAGLLEVQPWLDDAALEGRLKADCRSPRILHLATHG